jgi:2-polyprenyl-3-methyl-5-hydroxy-6-metoxy-1,4-benzoquinol methylase
LVNSFEYSAGNPPSESQLSDYTSNTLRLFLEGLEQVREAQILDVGPVCGENISFLAQRVKRLYICDMFFYLSRDSRKNLHPDEVWKHLDYPAHSFDGILLWNLVDHLDDREVGLTADLCYKILKPGGMLLSSVTGQSSIGTAACSFVVREGYRLNIESRPTMDLPLYVRNNREVLELLLLFRAEKSFRYQNGLREYFFIRD